MEREASPSLESDRLGPAFMSDDKRKPKRPAESTKTAEESEPVLRLVARGSENTLKTI